ncbi:MAG TPA: MliC family protein [Solimonas sp.]|nr:MliC family protein [Solimonas sp.]
MRHICSSLLALVLLAACSKSQEQAPQAAPEAAPAAAAPVAATPPDESGQPMPTMLVYQCEGSAQVTVANLDDQGQRIALTLPGETAVELPQAVSASGAKYDNGSLVFLGKGDEAVIERGGKAVYSQCKLQSAAGPATTE